MCFYELVSKDIEKLESFFKNDSKLNDLKVNFFNGFEITFFDGSLIKSKTIDFTKFLFVFAFKIDENQEFFFLIYNNECYFFTDSELFSKLEHFIKSFKLIFLFDPMNLIKFLENIDTLLDLIFIEPFIFFIKKETNSAYYNRFLEFNEQDVLIQKFFQKKFKLFSSNEPSKQINYNYKLFLFFGICKYY